MQPKEEKVLESFPVTIDELTSQEQPIPEFAKDPNFIQEALEIKVGDFIDIEVSPENYKRKYFTESIESGESILVRKTCRVAGEARSNHYGLGYFIIPKGCPKQPFPFFINEYGITWVAFRLEDNENDNSGK